jgi:hypothetical protein
MMKLKEVDTIVDVNVLDESGQTGYTLIISSCGFADKLSRKS